MCENVRIQLVNSGGSEEMRTYTDTQELCIREGSNQLQYQKPIKKYHDTLKFKFGFHKEYVSVNSPKCRQRSQPNFGNPETIWRILVRDK